MSTRIGWALVKVYGKVPGYQGRGRSPTRKHPQPGWQYAQMVKQRRNGRVVGTKLRVIYGDKPETLELLGISTVHAEHNHHTMRLPNGRLVRKASAVWEHLVYNLARPQRRYAWR